jgi:hypothetical protein
MDDLFVGRWSNVECTGPDFIKHILEGATMEISLTKGAYQVTLNPGAPYEQTWDMELADRRLGGRLMYGGQPYYCEITVRTPPSELHLQETMRRIYGTLCRIDSNSGGDLGDPGAWKAEDSGYRPPGDIGD